MNYYLINCDRSLNDAVIIDAVPENGPKGYVYKKLKPLSKLFPATAKVYFSSNYSSGIKLYDFVDNTLGVLIVSEAAKKVISETQKKYIEFLPVLMFDHKKSQVEGVKYFILNYFHDVDFVDKDNSNVVMNSINKETIFEIKGDVCIKKQNIPDDAHIFRAKNWPNQYVISETLENKIKEAGLSGYELQNTHCK